MANDEKEHAFTEKQVRFAGRIVRRVMSADIVDTTGSTLGEWANQLTDDERAVLHRANTLWGKAAFGSDSPEMTEDVWLLIIELLGSLDYVSNESAARMIAAYCGTR